MNNCSQIGHGIEIECEIKPKYVNSPYVAVDKWHLKGGIYSSNIIQ